MCLWEIFSFGTSSTVLYNSHIKFFYNFSLQNLAIRNNGRTLQLHRSSVTKQCFSLIKTLVVDMSYHCLSLLCKKLISTKVHVTLWHEILLHIHNMRMNNLLIHVSTLYISLSIF